MPDNRSHVDGARVLADLNALRSIGAYKTGVHKPTFSEPHVRSLEWLAQRLPQAGLAATIDGIGNVLGTSAKAGPKLLAGSHLESQNHAGWLDGPLGVIYALEAARVKRADVHAGCPKAPEYYLTVGLPIRGQPDGLRNVRDTRGRRVSLRGDVWTVLVDEHSAGPKGWSWSQYAWLFRRGWRGRLDLASTILIGVVE